MKDGPQLYLRCDWCHGFFAYNGGKRKRWCSDAHKQAAWRADNQPKTPDEVRAELIKRNGTHQCVEGFIIGVFNDDGVCMSCGERAV